MLALVCMLKSCDYVSVSALVFDCSAQNKRPVLKRGTAWNWLSLDSAAAAASRSEPSELQITARLVFHSSPRHYFRPEESWFVRVHIYNCDLGSRRRVTQPERSWREVTNEKQPKGSSYFITDRCWRGNIASELMKPSTSLWGWRNVPFGGADLVPGMPEQVPHQEQKHIDRSRWHWQHWKQ